MNKATRTALRDSILSMKVEAKKHGKAEHGSDEWHQTWDDAELAHLVTQLLLATKATEKDALVDKVHSMRRSPSYSRWQFVLSQLGFPIQEKWRW